MKKYQHVFFDLDRTLWDFNKNSMETLTEICKLYRMWDEYALSEAKFIAAYMKVNEELWVQYRKNTLSKEALRDRRFKETLMQVGIQDTSLAKAISTYYLSNCPKKKNLKPFVTEMLTYLDQHYYLHIITNGFAEAQRIKLENTGIGKFFKELIISEEIGHRKPSSKVFETAVEKVNGSMEESIMIGDDLEVDIIGAADAGMDQVYYNPDLKSCSYPVTYEVSCLSEVRSIL